MVKRTTLLLFLLVALVGSVHAQKKKSNKKKTDKKTATTKSRTKDKDKDNNNSKFGVATPKDMLELGMHGGVFFVAGDVTPEAGFGGGLHFRKALDYVFSLRGDVLFGEAKGMNATGFRQFTNQYYSATVLGVISLNSVRFDKAVRKVNFYALAGAGGNNFEVKYETERTPLVRSREFAPHITIGAGMAFRLSPRINISLENQATSVFGARSDLLDGYNMEGNGSRSVFGDMLNYARLGINFNLGSRSKLSEPLYWINPLDVVLKDISELKDKQDIVLEDSDKDGVLDIIDQEQNTPPDVPVDTKGRTLDSDRDGIADYKDMEPYNPPRPGEVVNASGVIENPINRPGGGGGGVTEDRVIELIDERIDVKIDEKFKELRLTENVGSVAEWFLPMIHFGVDASTVKYSDYGTLASIAQMMKGNAQLRLVVIGFTDETGQEERNNALSYDRAREVIDHLVVYHGIGRGRLVLQWQGQNKALVPTASSYVNRRVEFRVATSEDVEMDPPEGYEATTSDGY